jgi:hypothetical protein
MPDIFEQLRQLSMLGDSSKRTMTELGQNPILGQAMGQGLDQVFGRESGLRSIMEPLAIQAAGSFLEKQKRQQARDQTLGQGLQLLGPHVAGVAERFGIVPPGMVPGAKMVGGAPEAPSDQDLVGLGADELAAALAEQVGGGARTGSMAGGALKLNIPGLTVDTTPLRDARTALEQAVQKQAGAEDQAVNDISAAIQRVKGGQEQLGGIEERVAQSSAGVMQSMVDGMQKVEEAQKARVADAEKAYQDSLGAWEKAKQERAAATVDPQKVWGEGGAGAMMRIGAGISIALGHLGAALAGGPNTALTIIERSIDRALKAQESQVAAAGANAANALTSVGLARNLWQDAGTARTAAKIDMMEQAKLQLELINKRADSERAKANTEVLIGGLDEKMGLLKEDLHAKGFGRQLAGQQAQANVANMEINAERGNKAAELQTWQLKRQASMPKVRPALPPTLDYASPEFQPTQKQIDAAIKADATVQKVLPTLGRFIAWRKKNGAKLLSGGLTGNKLTETMAEGERLGQRLIISLKVADNMGANFSETEQAMEAIPYDDPGAFGNYLKSLETLESTFREEHTGFLKAYGLKPRRQGSARRELVRE